MSWTGRDHPRIRGEHKIASDFMDEMGGSSPHTRGAHRLGVVVPPGARIIPAYAGSTARARAEPDGTTDHPRIRGEHLPRNRRKRAVRGSSPHTRGARSTRTSARRASGIIPAYAGSTLIPCSRATSSSDHPRIRGEHGRAGVGVGRVWGSSPHTRGALYGFVVHGLWRRIIPAYAGSTAAVEAVSVRDPGSSPHTRGAHLFSFR